MPHLTATEKIDDRELVSFKEMMMANSIQVDALCQLLIEKGNIKDDEGFHQSLASKYSQGVHQKISPIAVERIDN